MKKPKTLASEINLTAQELLKKIRDEYIADTYIDDFIDDDDLAILMQSCKKLMEVSAKIRARELCH